MTKDILKTEIEKIKLDEEEKMKIDESVNFMTDALKKNLKKKKINADVFVGGSYAKGTMVRKDNGLQDVDIFVRFHDKKNIEKLNEVFDGINGNLIKIHGSRDYFRLKFRDVIFEIVPTLKVSSPEKAENITDLSYFHVDYVAKKIKKNPKLANEIKLAKAFCHSNNFYGAEGYIRGFSGYALELLIIHYGSFMNFVKAVSKAKDKIIIDMEKFYSGKEDVMDEMNESKLESPIVFVDPTFKQRNALAALSSETFERFKKLCKEFLKRPTLKFFEEKKINENDIMKEAKKKKAEFLKISLTTDRQEGDIAGTKMFKFYNFLSDKIEKYFSVLRSEFSYGEGKKADVYFILKSKKEIVIDGPPVKMKESVVNFKKAHKKVFIKGGRICAKVKVDFSPREFVMDVVKKYDNVILGMGIININVN